MGHETFTVGDLEAVIGDNAADEKLKHRAGYNGLWSLKHRTGGRSIFVPGIAGLNLEHIVSGEGEEDKNVFFEPRKSPMTFRKISDSVAELHQPPTPTFHLESWTRFELNAPDYIDMTFRCRATQHVFRYGYIGLFWASYINAPDDKSIYFPGGDKNRSDQELWSQLCTPSHNTNSTVKGRGDEFKMTFAKDSPNALYKNFSPLVYDLPLYYGNFENHVFALMFEKSEGIRFTHSPSGGGANAGRKTTNPAWDIQFIIPEYDVETDYSFRVRALFREKCSRNELLKEFGQWKESL